MKRIHVAAAVIRGPESSVLIAKRPLDKHQGGLWEFPGGKVEDTELEQEHGRYVYQVELRDAQGVQWDVELDATNGQILQEHRDD